MIEREMLKAEKAFAKGLTQSNAWRLMKATSFLGEAFQ